MYSWAARHKSATKAKFIDSNVALLQGKPDATVANELFTKADSSVYSLQRHTRFQGRRNYRFLPYFHPIESTSIAV